MAATKKKILFANVSWVRVAAAVSAVASQEEGPGAKVNQL